MTPEEQDKELREKLTKLISQDGWVDIYEVDVDGQVNELMQLIAAYTNKQVEAKLAHISEYAENVISIDENGEFNMKAIPLSLVAVERNKLKESKNDKL